MNLFKSVLYILLVSVLISCGKDDEEPCPNAICLTDAERNLLMGEIDKLEENVQESFYMKISALSQETPNYNPEYIKDFDSFKNLYIWMIDHKLPVLILFYAEDPRMDSEIKRNLDVLLWEVADVLYPEITTSLKQCNINDPVTLIRDIINTRGDKNNNNTGVPCYEEESMLSLEERVILANTLKQLDAGLIDYFNEQFQILHKESVIISSPFMIKELDSYKLIYNWIKEDINRLPILLFFYIDTGESPTHLLLQDLAEALFPEITESVYNLELSYREEPLVLIKEILKEYK